MHACTGEGNRAVGATSANPNSSRSHAIFTVYIEVCVVLMSSIHDNIIKPSFIHYLIYWFSLYQYSHLTSPHLTCTVHGSLPVKLRHTCSQSPLCRFGGKRVCLENTCMECIHVETFVTSLFILSHKVLTLKSLSERVYYSYKWLNVISDSCMYCREERWHYRKAHSSTDPWPSSSRCDLDDIQLLIYDYSDGWL